MDRLGSLPDEILHLILSHLPIISQVETSLLSQRWSLNPALRMVNLPIWIYKRKYHSFSFIHQVLRQWQAAHIPEIQANLAGLNIGLGRDVALSTQWIDFVSLSSLQHLSLVYDMDNNHQPDGPPLSKYIERGKGLPSLEKLSLTQVPLTEGPPLAQYIQKGLVSLKVLHLNMVKIKDSDFVSLLLACPCLEVLKIEFCSQLNHTVISSSSLKFLRVDTCSFGSSRIESLELVETPNLVKLECFVMHCQILTVQKEIPHLMDLSLFSNSINSAVSKDPIDVACPDSFH